MHTDRHGWGEDTDPAISKNVKSVEPSPLISVFIRVHPWLMTASFSKRLFQFLKQPGAGVGPSAFGGALRDAEQPGRLNVRQTREETQFDQLCPKRVVRGQFFQRLIHRQQMLII